MDKELLEKVETNQMKCVKCGLIIPYVFKKGAEYTCPSFTLVDEEPVCYHCFHPLEYSKR